MYCNLVQLICFLVVATNCQEVSQVNQSDVASRPIIDSCKLPHYPTFGYWEIYKKAHQSPGEIVPSGTVLQIHCKNKYKLDGEKTIVCINGNWSHPIGNCLRTCRSLYSSPAVRVTCTYNDRKLENCMEAITGTKAHFQCGDFYEDLKLEKNPTSVCYNGRWSEGVPQCSPICGRKSPKDPTLIVGGKNATKGEFPWQAALYNATDKDLLCGGSLLNQRVILTAAHCVTDIHGELLSKDSYIVAVGKYYRRYDHPHDFNEAQFSEIDQIFVPKNFKADIQNYFGDVAIIVTKRTFELSLRVQPVCVDWSLKHFPTLLDPSIIQHGYVTGWGFTVEYKSPSSVLKELKVPIVYDHESCVSKLSEDYNKYLTDDKLCAGFLDRGTSVCRGDSGGGLVSKFGNRFYVVGVVSISPQAYTPEGGCDSHQVALYTKVSYYINNFIQAKEVQFRPYPLEEVPCEEDPNCLISPIRGNFSRPEIDAEVPFVGGGGGGGGGGTSGGGEGPSLSNLASGAGGVPMPQKSHVTSEEDDEEPPKYSKLSNDKTKSGDPSKGKNDEDNEESAPSRKSQIPNDDDLPPPRRSQIPKDDKLPPPRKSQSPDDDVIPPPSHQPKIADDDVIPPPPHRPKISTSGESPPPRRSQIPDDDEIPPPPHRPTISTGGESPPPHRPTISTGGESPPPRRSQNFHHNIPPPPRRSQISTGGASPPSRSSQIPDDHDLPPSSWNSPRNTGTRRATRGRIG